MSERRKARAAATCGPQGGVPDELLSRLHPIWKKPAAVRKRFPQYVRETDFTTLAFHRLHGTLLIRWAVANGYESEKYPLTADWHRLRAAGWGRPSSRDRLPRSPLPTPTKGRMT